MKQFWELTRFLISGVVGTAVGFVTYRLIWWLLPEFSYRTTAAWFINYNVAVARQHWLHCRFTFAAEKRGFWSTLPRAYMIYSIVLVVTTAFNAVLVGRFGFGPDLAWVCCYGLAMLINYPIVKRFIYTRSNEKQTAGDQQQTHTL